MIPEDDFVGFCAFKDLENQYGHESACHILRGLEQMEGISQASVSKLSFDERMENVLSCLTENMRYQTHH